MDLKSILSIDGQSFSSLLWTFTKPIHRDQYVGGTLDHLPVHFRDQHMVSWDNKGKV